MKFFDENNAFSDTLREVGTIFNPAEMSEEELINDMNTKRVVSALIVVASLILTIMNVVNKYWVMAGTTLGLGLMFGVAFVLTKDIKNRKIVVIIMAISIMGIFTYYAISGQNEGFAILWVLLVPMIGSLVLGLRAGTIVGLYYLILIVILFYTPLKSIIADDYTKTFMVRFPVLYFIDLVISTYSAIRKEYYKIKIEEMSYKDTLTGLYNRRYARNQLTRIEQNHSLRDFIVISIDVNRLKYVNDNYGHECGDRLLIDVARYLKKRFSAIDDIVCRCGGDEYAVFTYAKNDEVENIKKYFDDYKFIFNGNLIEEPSISAGIICANDNPDCDIDELIRRADEQMYVQKQIFYVCNRIVRREG